MRALFHITLFFLTMTISAQNSIHEFKVEALDGDSIDFSEFQGKKILVVNTASECGYTPQYEQLQELYEEMGDKLVIVGFPANNYGGQEPDMHGEKARQGNRAGHRVAFRALDLDR